MAAMKLSLSIIMLIAIAVVHTGAQVNDFDVEYESESSEKRDEEYFFERKSAPEVKEEEEESNPENEGKLKPRISGGHVAPEFHNPAQLYILKTTSSKESGKTVTTFLCGATLVKAANIHIVVTAKSCIAESNRSTIPLELLQVVGGTNSRKFTSIHTQRRFVQEAAFPPHTEGDVALLFINPDFLETRALRPAVLPTFKDKPEEFPNPTVLISGWGRHGNSTEVSDVLRYAYMFTYSADDCAHMFRYRISLSKNSFCGIPIRGRPPLGGPGLISEGDKGGPVIAYSSRNATDQELIGVIGDPITGVWMFPRKPSIFHRTDPHVEWIVQESYRFMATVLPNPDSEEETTDHSDPEI